MGDFSGKVEPLSDDEKKNLKKAEKEFFAISEPKWRDFENLLGQNPICTRDEGGVGMSAMFDAKGKLDYHSDDKMLTKNTDAIAAFWVTGRSEGYYLHVRPVLSSKGRFYDHFGKPEMLGKFWGVDTAEACTNYINRIGNRLTR